MMQGNPVGQRFSFGDGHERVDENGIVLAEDQCRGARIERRWWPKRPDPLRHHGFFRRGENVDVQCRLHGNQLLAHQCDFRQNDGSVRPNACRDLPTAKPISCSQSNGGSSADCGRSRGGRCTGALRPTKASKAAVSYVRLKSTPAGRFAQLPVARRRQGNGLGRPEALIDGVWLKICPYKRPDEARHKARRTLWRTHRL